MLANSRTRADKHDELDRLIDGAEGLLTRLTDAHDPTIRALRDRVDHAINGAWHAIAREDGRDRSASLGDVARTIDDYVRDYPWLALVTGVLMAGTVAYIAGAARPRRP